jgi:hypothetical protein
MGITPDEVRRRAEALTPDYCDLWEAAEILDRSWHCSYYHVRRLRAERRSRRWIHTRRQEKFIYKQSEVAKVAAELRKRRNVGVMEVTA